MCAVLIGGLFDCANGVNVHVPTCANFGVVDNSSPVTNGRLVVTLYYQWPVYATFF